MRQRKFAGSIGDRTRNLSITCTCIHVCTESVILQEFYEFAVKLWLHEEVKARCDSVLGLNLSVFQINPSSFKSDKIFRLHITDVTPCVLLPLWPFDRATRL